MKFIKLNTSRAYITKDDKNEDQQPSMKRCHSLNSQSPESIIDDRESLNNEDLIKGFVVKDSKQEESQSKIYFSELEKDTYH